MLNFGTGFQPVVQVTTSGWKPEPQLDSPGIRSRSARQ